MYRLDLSYNRISGPPLLSNSPLKEDEDVISQLPELLPYLTRHIKSGADMPDDVKAVYDAVVQVRERLQAEIDAEVCFLNPESARIELMCEGGGCRLR